MVCDARVEEIREFVGHDGSEIVDPNIRFPLCHRGFSMEEMVEFALSKNIALVKMDCFPIVTTNGENRRELWPEAHCVARMQEALQDYTGLLIGEVPHGNRNWHVVAWNHVEEMCYDPSAPRPLKAITINPAQFYIALRIESKLMPLSLNSEKDAS